MNRQDTGSTVQKTTRTPIFAPTRRRFHQEQEEFSAKWKEIWDQSQATNLRPRFRGMRLIQLPTGVALCLRSL